MSGMPVSFPDGSEAGVPFCAISPEQVGRARTSPLVQGNGHRAGLVPGGHRSGPTEAAAETECREMFVVIAMSG